MRTRADPVPENEGGGWRITGQKVWTSGAAIADYGMLIARTDWDVPKHRGISFFFLPMKQKGVTVRPLRQITDERIFNEVFIDDAFVPEDNLLGPLNGWSVLKSCSPTNARSWATPRAGRGQARAGRRERRRWSGWRARRDGSAITSCGSAWRRPSRGGS
ncbi:acyl-CoA dehydrogenase family protein [Sphingomonas sp. MMS24-JH45]